MITRTFLFLLALVTGFSAANAEQVSRPVLSQSSVSVSAVKDCEAALETHARTYASVSFMAQYTIRVTCKVYGDAANAPDQIVRSPRTYRADRARE